MCIYDIYRGNLILKKEIHHNFFSPILKFLKFFYGCKGSNFKYLIALIRVFGAFRTHSDINVDGRFFVWPPIKKKCKNKIKNKIKLLSLTVLTRYFAYLLHSVRCIYGENFNALPQILFEIHKLQKIGVVSPLKPMGVSGVLLKRRGVRCARCCAARCGT